MTTATNLKVSSHVGRDLLDSAARFKTEEAAVWEYVVNSLQYVDPGVFPKIQVTVQPRRKRVQISDNGRGMSHEDLAHFFTMHAENRERAAGRPGRGKFGTGKSAAFGIGEVLTIETRKDGLLNEATLTRDIIEQSDGQDIPVRWEVRDAPTRQSNGTVVTIDGIFLDRLQRAPIISYIERHLQTWRVLSPEVAVNDHVCETCEPEFAESHEFQPRPEEASVLGNVRLIVNVARVPLPDADQGVVVTAGLGNRVAVETTGIESKEFGTYLFGEIDVPALETSESPIEPFDSSRSLQLNPRHPVAAVLLGFIGSNLECVRMKLVERAKEARRSEQARRLAREANRIAEVLNEDFQQLRKRLEEIRSASAHSSIADSSVGDLVSSGDEDSAWVRGTTEPGELTHTESDRPPPCDIEEEDEKERPPGNPPAIDILGEKDEDGKNVVDPAGGGGKKRRRPQGGFRVEYRNLGKSESRSHYDGPTLTIFINLDHAVVAAALGAGTVEDPGFQRLSYEIAFSEYAIALGHELFNHDPNMPGDDLLFEVRSSLNRVATAAARLYI